MKHFLYILIIFCLSLQTLNSQVIITCNDVELATRPIREIPYSEAIEGYLNDTIEACEVEFRGDSLIQASYHPFMQTLEICYSSHRPVTISPDMIWLLICQGFSKHINYNAEELRGKIVDFEGEKSIEITTDNSGVPFVKGDSNNPWKLIFTAFSDSIKNNVNEKFYNLFDQKFSTTTLVEHAAFEVTLMETVDVYYDYVVMTMCGVPSITLTGTTEDWKKIKSKLKDMKGYGIDHWVKSLNPILNEFIKASENKVNHDFWQKIYKIEPNCGMEYITGWIIHFFPYLKSNTESPRPNPFLTTSPRVGFEGLKDSDFDYGISKIDFTWKINGQEYEMEFLAGFIGIRQDKNTMMLTPEIGWVVKSESKK